MFFSLKVTMTVLLLLLLTFITVGSPQKLKEMYVKSGDMEILRCGDCKHSDTLTIWTKETLKETTFLYSNMTAAEQRHLGVVVSESCLVILSAAVHHQGNYSCDRLRKDRSPLLFRLTVYTTESKEYKEKNQYNTTCYTQEACILDCPEGNIPEDCSPNITLKNTTWHKENGELAEGYFSSTERNNSGVYICTRSYLYSGQIYNMSFIVVLDVQPGKPVKSLGISTPDNGQVFEVELGKRMEIVCKALVDTCPSLSSLFWLEGSQFVEESKSRISNNSTCDASTTQLIAPLVFTEVQEEDLSKSFTCKHESDIQPAFVSISLTEKARPSYTALAVCIAFIVVLTALAVVIYMRFKVDITLFFRDSLGCQSSTSDGKTYDAFLMCYKNDGGLNEDDRRLLENTLEEQFGYKLCLYDRDILPGHAEAVAVLDTVENSQSVVLVPCGPDPGPGTSVLSAIHEALVERKTRLILINIEQTEGLDSDSLPGALQLLSKAGGSITWKGSPPPSSFWKELRYHLPAPQCAQRKTHQLVPQGVV